MKEIYLISYDMAEGGNYEDLYGAIQAYGTWAHITDSLFAVVTEQSAKKIRENLVEYFPKGSRLFIVKSGTEAAWRNVMCSNKWLKEKL